MASQDRPGSPTPAGAPAGVGSTGAGPLRVGILLGGLRQPRWIQALIEDLAGYSGASVVLVALLDEVRAPAAGSTAPGRIGGSLPLLGALYSRWDDALHQRPDDALIPVSLDRILRPFHPFRLPAKGDGPVLALAPDEIALLKSYRLDVALLLGARRLGPEALEVARLGIWSLDGAGPPDPRGVRRGFPEVLSGSPVTEARLVRLGRTAAEDRTLYRSFSATDPYSVRRTWNQCARKSSTFVTRRLRALSEEGSLGLEPGPQEPPTTPGIAEGGRGGLVVPMARLCGRYLRHKLNRVLRQEQWFLAFGWGTEEPIPRVLHRLLPPADRYWADPFPVQRSGRYHVFFEEVPFETGKGHLCVAELDSRGLRGRPERVLERDYHLSYPFVFEWEGALWMVPESHECGAVDLFRCEDFPAKWKREETLLRGVRAFDPTLCEIGGRWWLFANIPAGSAEEQDELHLFHAPCPRGPWTAHRGNPVISDARTARPAGRLFLRRGEWFRPAQDCSRGYGHAMVVNRVLRIDPDAYREVEAFKVLPDWHRSLVGTHTLNRAGDLAMVDGLRLRWKGLAVS